MDLANGTWGGVPLSLIEDSKLNLDSRAVACWLATRPNGWQILIKHMLNSLSLGRDRWRRIALELENAKYLIRNPSPSGESGRWIWQIIFCPVPMNDSTADGFAGDGQAITGSAVDGKPGDKNEMEVKQIEKPKKERGRASVCPAGARPRVPRSGGRGLVIDEKTGLYHEAGNVRDAWAIEQIQKFDPGQIAAARKACAMGDDQGRAFPSAVLRHLRRAQGRAAGGEPTPAWARGLLPDQVDNHELSGREACVI